MAASTIGLCGGFAAAGTNKGAKVAAAEVGKRSLGDLPVCLDYSRAFLCGTSPNNSVRFVVESRTIVFDEHAKTAVQYLQCASCKSEDTFAKRDLFYQDNYDFLPIHGEGGWLVFRRKATLNPNYRELREETSMWGTMNQRLTEAASTTTLTTWEQIRDATAAGTPIVAQTEIRNAETGLSALIEYPVKTMNIGITRQMYQVDTGPIALPDLSRRYTPRIDCLRLAFVAFNVADFADFVVEQPTPVTVEGQEKYQVHHYSSPISLPARNVLLAIGGV